MKMIIAVLILASAGFAGWWGYSPNPVMDQFQAAVDGGKPEAVAPFLDMPALQENIAKFVKLRFNQPDKPEQDLTADQVKSTVDAFLTPANIILIMKGNQVEPGKALPSALNAKDPFSVQKHYLSPDVYAIDVYLSQVASDDNKISLLFEREGLFDWKLGNFQFSWGT